MAFEFNCHSAVLLLLIYSSLLAPAYAKSFNFTFTFNFDDVSEEDSKNGNNTSIGSTTTPGPTVLTTTARSSTRFPWGATSSTTESWDHETTTDDTWHEGSGEDGGDFNPGATATPNATTTTTTAATTTTEKKICRGSGYTCRVPTETNCKTNSYYLRYCKGVCARCGF